MNETVEEVVNSDDASHTVARVPSEKLQRAGMREQNGPRECTQGGYRSATEAIGSSLCSGGGSSGGGSSVGGSSGGRAGERSLLGTPRRTRTGAEEFAAHCRSPANYGDRNGGQSSSVHCQQRRAVQEKRQTLRQTVPPWGVLLDHRINGKLINVSRTGLAVETRQAPSSFSTARMKVSWSRGEPIQLDVDVMWCRMIGVEDGIHGETVPRYVLGLSCSDVSLVKLGAPREA